MALIQAIPVTGSSHSDDDCVAALHNSVVGVITGAAVVEADAVFCAEPGGEVFCSAGLVDAFLAVVVRRAVGVGQDAFDCGFDVEAEFPAVV